MEAKTIFTTLHNNAIYASYLKRAQPISFFFFFFFFFFAKRCVGLSDI